MSAIKKLKSFDDLNYPPELERLAEDLSQLCWNQVANYDEYCHEMTVWMILGVSQWAFGDEHGFLSCDNRTRKLLGGVVDELCRNVGADGDAECAEIFAQAHTG